MFPITVVREIRELPIKLSTVIPDLALLEKVLLDIISDEVPPTNGRKEMGWCYEEHTSSKKIYRLIGGSHFVFVLNSELLLLLDSLLSN